jgi:hypothetical protein
MPRVLTPALEVLAADLDQRHAAVLPAVVGELRLGVDAVHERLFDAGHARLRLVADGLDASRSGGHRGASRRAISSSTAVRACLDALAVAMTWPVASRRRRGGRTGR